MTKKHYQKIAEIIKKYSFPRSDNPWNAEYYIDKDILIYYLSEVFKEDNSNFDEIKFKEACNES